MHAIRIHNVGDTDVMKLESVPIPEPADHEVLIRIKAIGVNYIDVYNRKGLYKHPLPLILGQEAAGIIEKVGKNVTEFQQGDRVAYCGIIGSYAEFAVVPAHKVVALPNLIDFQLAAAVLLQGMTAHYLTHSTYNLKAGDVCLVHAAAGGVGLLLVQMAKYKGATVIGTVSNSFKAELAKNAGADFIIDYTSQDFEAEVKKLTQNTGVNVVYDSIGQTTFEKSLNCLKPRGLMVSFGQSSGIIPSLDVSILSAKGSLYLTRPNLSHYTATRDELTLRANEVFQMILSKKLKVRIDKTFPLSDAALAHQYLESRQSAGKLLLIP